MPRQIVLMLSTIILATPVALALTQPVGGGEAINLMLPRGDAAAGRAAFVSLQCTTCHPVAGDLDLQAPSTASPGPRLGAALAAMDTSTVANSIVAPSHTISTRIDPIVASHMTGTLSPMADFSAVMTVRQLADLVAYIRDELPPTIALTLDASLEGNDLTISGTTGLPDGALLGYAVRHEQMAIDTETPEWMLFTEGAVTISDGRFRTVVDASALDPGEFAVSVAFTVDLPKGASQPDEVLERFGQRCEKLNGPNVVLLRNKSRAVLATTVVQR